MPGSGTAGCVPRLWRPSLLPRQAAWDTQGCGTSGQIAARAPPAMHAGRFRVSTTKTNQSGSAGACEAGTCGVNALALVAAEDERKQVICSGCAVGAIAKVRLYAGLHEQRVWSQR